MLIALLILLVLFTAALFGIYCYVFFSPRAGRGGELKHMDRSQLDPLQASIDEMKARQRARPFETVSIRSDDGLTLYGMLYDAGDADAPLVIAFHGYRGNPIRDLSGGADIYLGAGCRLLLPEQRAHGRSGGYTITYGVRERNDCLRWAEYARERFGASIPIVLAGISMGAATVLMASGLDLPENVRGILADAPYTSPDAIIETVCRQFHLPTGLFMPLIRLSARIIAGFGLRDADAAEAVKAARVPILLIHGEADHFVPCEMGREIAAANPALIDLETFPDAGHGLSCLIDRPRYESLARAFLARVLSPADSG